VTTLQTPGERLSRLDTEIEELKQAFVDAAVQLMDTPEVDGSFHDRMVVITNRLKTLRSKLNAADYDKDQLAKLYTTLLDIRDLMDEPEDLDTIDRLLIAVEQVRHVIRDALDEHVSGVADDIGVVMEELQALLPNVRQDQIAELIGVDRRTLSRWLKKAGPPPPRLRAVARLVAILRHNWTEDGIVAWFYRPRRDLDGRTPISVLRQQYFDEDALIMSARAGRSQYAS
jgi:transcriptional regulator with XRE-family HTH domain